MNIYLHSHSLNRLYKNRRFTQTYLITSPKTRSNDAKYNCTKLNLPFNEPSSRNVALHYVLKLNLRQF